MKLKHGNLQKYSIKSKPYVDGNVFFEDISEVLRTREKNRNNIRREKTNIKNLVSDYIRYKEYNLLGHVQRMNEKIYLEKVWNGVRLEEEERGDLEIPGSRI